MWFKMATAGFYFRVEILLIYQLFFIFHAQAAINFKPEFTLPSPIIHSIKEDTAAGTIVLTLEATDTENEPLKFSLDDVGRGLFNINETSGELTLTYSSLDRESKSSYTFKAYVEDNFNGGGDSRKAETDVVIYLTDVNDNIPVFQNIPYFASVPENATNGTTIITVSATDADTGSNAKIDFSFNPPQTDFEIKSSSAGTAEVKLIGALDYEVIQRYTVLVVATDKGSPSLNKSVTIIIDVQDISDNPPQFLKSTYFADILENSPIGTYVHLVKAIDGDTGVNNAIKYSIESGNNGNVFAIDDSTGNLTVNASIDRELVSSYSLVVKAVEIPDPTSESTVDVIIIVVDVNDNKPTFKHDSYHVIISEGALKGYKLTLQEFTAQDNDQKPNYKDFEYKIDGANCMFAIDKNTGELTVNATLDYETQVNYTFTVTAIETGSTEKFNNRVTVTVELTNDNDNQPKFGNSMYEFTLQDTVALGSLIGTVQATDLDAGVLGEITYELLSEIATFQINGTSGQITNLVELDFDTRPSYAFKVTARDGGADAFTKTLTDIADITVLLTDLNDNTPKYSNLPAAISITENQNVECVYTVEASDSDSGDNANISFSIVSGNDNNNFTLDSVSGNVTLNGMLDYEAQSKFTLEIMATDKGAPSLNSTGILTINVEDENDNTPCFSSDWYNATVSENSPVGFTVMKLTAKDEDGGVNGQINYLIISGNDDSLFYIRFGYITTINYAYRERNENFTLVVTATDGGSPPRSCNTTVFIQVEDINDEFPVFDVEPYGVPIIKEFTDISTSSCRVVCGDININSSIIILHVEYRKTSQPLFTPVSINTDCSDAVLLGLEPSTEYQVRLRLYTELYRKGKESAEKRFKTEEEPYGVPIIKEFTDISTSSCRVVCGDININSSIIILHVEYRKTSQPLFTPVSINTDCSEAVLLGLEPSTEYQVRLRLYTELYRKGKESAEKIFKTEEELTSSSPSQNSNNGEVDQTLLIIIIFQTVIIMLLIFAGVIVYKKVILQRVVPT